MVGLPDGEKKLENIHFDRIHERKRQTDRQTDTARQHKRRFCIVKIAFLRRELLTFRPAELCYLYRPYRVHESSITTDNDATE